MFHLLGSSPHVRGALVERYRTCTRQGIIPACAGSTLRILHCPCGVRDHPRMCGEHRVLVLCEIVELGSSPHVRGALEEMIKGGAERGIIPACAGSTWGSAVSTWTPWDHPRMCGEHEPCFSQLYTTGGSSPHVRGARLAEGARADDHGIIPACAGSTAKRLFPNFIPRDHPRMCGEHLHLPDEYSSLEGSSPHVRGARRGAGDSYHR